MFTLCSLLPSFEYARSESFIGPDLINQIPEEVSNKKPIDEELQKDIYILGPGDELIIEILSTEIKARPYKVLNDGSISIFLAGEFIASGKTIPQLKLESLRVLKKVFYNLMFL